MPGGPRQYTFSRLKRPPIPGKKGKKKVGITAFGVIEFDETVDQRGLVTMRATAPFAQAGCLWGGRFQESFQTPRHHRSGDISKLADPSVRPAFYFSTIGSHSVILWEDKFWAVLFSQPKYKSNRSAGLDRHFTHQVYKLLEPGAAYVGKDASGTWEGLSEESSNFLQNCLIGAGV